MDNLFGIPLPIVGFFCFILAGVFVFAWPKPKSGIMRGMWTNMGLHYLHPLVWVLLGMAAFLQNRSGTAAAVTAGLGGLVYVFFIVLLIRESGK
jgi:hypothetical protein